MIGETAAAILLDIEGTVAPIAFVHEVLFPYAREHAERFLRDHWNAPGVMQARMMLDPQSAGFSPALLASIMQEISRLMDADAKSTGLKQLQGLIWDEGYRGGALMSPVYPDVAVALRRWTDAGKVVAIYSSGSVAAQKVFFRHTDAGDLTPFISAYFDTTTGPKRSPQSYATIAGQLDLPAGKILFISDVLEEAHAAAQAGMRGLIAARPGNMKVISDEFEQVEGF